MTRIIQLLQPVDGLKYKYHPFANGSQYWSWFGANCDQCDRYKEDPDTGVEIPGECTIADAIGLASMTDGSVDRGIATRMGYLAPGKNGNRYIWDCLEKVARQATNF